MPQLVAEEAGQGGDTPSASEDNGSFVEPEWLKKSKANGKNMNLFKTIGEQKSDQKVMPVFHKFMAKFLEEDNDGNISMLGTIIQQVSGISMDTGSKDRFKFDKFRINDVGATTDVIELRREVPVPHFGTRATYNANIPMQKDTVFSVPPYEIFKCTGLIELQTSSHSYEKNIPSDPDAMDGFGAEPVTETCEVRPDIYINPKDERELFITRKAADINNTDSYEMVCEAPRVEIMYDKKKQYCPKYQVSWYLEKPPGSQIVTTFAPLLFTALLAVLNVVNAEGEGPALDNSIALCLTIVFVLPNLRVDGRGHKMHVAKGWKGKFWNFYYEVLLSNNAIVFFFFLGLAFTSVAHPWFFHMGRDFAEENAEGSGDWHAENGEARDYVPLTFWYKEHGITGLAFGPAERFGMIGMIFFVVSMIIPCLNYRRYSKFKKQIIKSSIVKLGKHGADVFNNAKGKGGKEKNKPKTISDDMDHSWKKSADDERLAFAKDKTFDLWELQDSAVGKEAKKQTKSKDELTQVVASMNSVKTVWDAVTNAESATALNPAFDGKEVSAEAFSSHWKAKPEDPTLFCGPSHIEDEA